MTWIDRPEIRIARQDGRLTAELRGGDLLGYKAVEANRESGGTEIVCPTVDHIIAAAGW